MDAVRRPAEFLPFTQVTPGMQVLDVATGAGYTSQLLALAVGPGGTLWAQTPQPGRDGHQAAERPSASEFPARDANLRGPGSGRSARARPHHDRPQLPRHFLSPRRSREDERTPVRGAQVRGDAWS